MPQGVAVNQNKKKKGRPPAHQNKFAFRHNPKSKKTATILASPIEHCCQKCHDKLEWRKKYRKYKPLTQPSTCNICHQRNITAAYHTVCDTCSRKSTKAIDFLKNWHNSSRIITSDINSTDDDNAIIEQDSVTSMNDVIEIQPGSDDMEVESNTNPTIIHRRVCTICFKAPSIPASDDESSTEDNAENDRKLRLREIKSMQRQVERQNAEKRRLRRANKEKGVDSNKNNSTDNSSDSDNQSENDDEDDNDDDDDGDDGNENKNKNSKLIRNIYVENDNDVDDDPFLRAVGGADKLLTGEAYQRMLLHKNQNELKQNVC